MISIDRRYETGYLRPLGRGLVLEENYFADMIQEELEKQNLYSPSGGSELKGIHIRMEIEEARKR